jgi:hypothetical protein
LKAFVNVCYFLKIIFLRSLLHALNINNLWMGYNLLDFLVSIYLYFISSQFLMTALYYFFLFNMKCSMRHFSMIENFSKSNRITLKTSLLSLYKIFFFFHKNLSWLCKKLKFNWAVQQRDAKFKLYTTLWI